MSTVPGGAEPLAPKVAPLSVETSFVTVSVGRVTVMTVGVPWVVVAPGEVDEVAVVLTVSVPELPVVTVPEATVSVNVLRSPTMVATATVVPAMAVESATVVVFATGFLVTLVTVYAL